MGQIKGLTERHGTFYARLVVPADVRPALDGKTELRARLGTDRRQAERDVHGALATFYGQINAARVSLAEATTPKPHTPGALAPPDLARALYAHELAFDDAERLAVARGLAAAEFSDGWNERYEAALRRIASRRATDDEIAAHIGYAIDSFTAKGLTTAERGSPEWRRIGETFAVVRLESLSRQAERDQGNFSGEPKHPVLVANPDPVPAATAPKGDSARILGPESLLPLAEVVLRMQREKSNIRPATQQEQRVAIRWFDEFLGEALPIHRITRRMVLNYKDALPNVPVLYTQRFPGLTLPAAIEANRRRPEPYPTLAPATINNKWLTHLKSVFNWALQNDFIPDNPAQGVRLNLGKSDGEPTKLPFTDADLAMILGSPTFRAPLGERQWAVLVALHTGMRGSEIAQLRLEGIRDERGVRVFSTSDRLKNQASRRIIPMHPDLVVKSLAITTP